MSGADYHLNLFDASAIAWIHAYRLAPQVKRCKQCPKVAILWSAGYAAVIRFQFLNSERVFGRDPETKPLNGEGIS